MLDLVTSPLAEKYATKIPLILSNIQFPHIPNFFLSALGTCFKYSVMYQPFL